MAKTKDDFKETFKRLDQFLNDEITWRECDLPKILNSPPMSFSKIDNIFGELTTEGEDRVFGHSSKLLVNPRPPRPLSFRSVTKPKDVTYGKMKKVYRIKTVQQVQVLKKALDEEKDPLDDWVVVESYDINAKK